MCACVREGKERKGERRQEKAAEWSCMGMTSMTMTDGGGRERGREGGRE